ncbi:MAG: PhoH family protein [Rhodocyclaceae bacterium]|nr:PhoH family protein [Rhodocyclaceae bacterium]
MNAKTAKPVTKLFVLDTNVLMHDPTCLYRFQEHDIFLPMMTLEELDANKKGMSEVARNARQASRLLDEIVSGCEHAIKQGIELTGPSRGLASGKLHLQTETMNGGLPASLPTSRGDNQILAVLIHLRDAQTGRHVILVSKDINMRIKARALGLEAQDYFNDKVLEDTDLLYPGTLELPADFWETHGQDMKSWKEDGRTLYRVGGPLCQTLLANQFLYLDAGQDKPFQSIVRENDGKTAVLSTLIDYGHAKNAIWGITARNREQNFALNLLMNPEIDFVTLLGQAGTGKTLLTLAAGLTQTLESKRYAEIIITRVTVPVGEDIGFLPGSEEEKMTPWMGAIEDNLEVLNKPADGVEKSGGSATSAGFGGSHGGQYGGDWGRAATMDLIKSRIRIKSLNFMRGRTFLSKFLIIDEAQNLTPKQMKTLITRAGPGTKVVCMGNIAQIDTPYLTEGSSGITYVVDRFKGWPHSGHITLQRGERSRLAEHAAEVL